MPHQARYLVFDVAAQGSPAERRHQRGGDEILRYRRFSLSAGHVEELYRSAAPVGAAAPESVTPREHAASGDPCVGIRRRADRALNAGLRFGGASTHATRVTQGRAIG